MLNQLCQNEYNIEIKMTDMKTYRNENNYLR